MKSQYSCNVVHGREHLIVLRLTAIKMMSQYFTFTRWHVNGVIDKRNQLTGHLIIIKHPERFSKSDEHPKSMNKLTLKEPAIKTSKQTELIIVFNINSYSEILCTEISFGTPWL